MEIIVRSNSLHYMLSGSLLFGIQRHIIYVLLIGVSFFLFSATASAQSQQAGSQDVSLTATRAGEKITAVVVKNFPPHYLVDENGEAQGFAIDILNEVALRMSLDVTYVIKDDWSQTANALKQGKADLIPNLGISPERENYFDFTSPVETFPISIIVRSDTKHIRNGRDLLNKTVGVVKFNVGAKIARQYVNNELVVYPQPENALIALLAGHVDALVYPKSVIQKVARESDLGHRINILPAPLKEIKRAMAVARGNTALLMRLNAGIATLVQSSEYEEIYSKWYGKPAPYWTVNRVMLVAFGVILLTIIIAILWRNHTLAGLNKRLVVSAEAEKAIEKALKESSLLMQNVLDSTPDLIFVKNKQLQTIMCNKAFSLAVGKNPEEIYGNTDIENGWDPELVKGNPDKNIRGFEQDDLEALSGKDVYNPYDPANVEGETRIFDTHKLPLRDSEGNIIGMLGVARDITERKVSELEREELQQQLQQAQKMESIGQLTGGVAHDFNNILASILGFTSLALQRFVKDDQPELREYLNEVTHAGERARDLVSQMLAFSRTGINAAAPMQLPVGLQEITKMLHATLPSSIQLSTEIDVDVPSVMMDPGKLQQILLNMCINARDAIGEKGNINIQVCEVQVGNEPLQFEPGSRVLRDECDACHNKIAKGEYVRLSVRDTGAGIEKDKLRRIFEPFFTTKEVGKGTGMGLSMVHGIVHDSGGHILVDSQPGIGTVFHMLFPVCEELPMSEPGVGLLNGPTASNLGDSQILIVDDELSVAKFIGDLLESRGGKVTVLTDSQAALALFKQDPTAFDLLISDQTMPYLTGVELSQQILAIRPEFPVILCSGYSDQVNETKARALGIRGYLSKPMSNSALLELVVQSLAVQNS